MSLAITLDQTVKYCPDCKDFLPMDREHFYFHKKNKCGFSTYCIHHQLERTKAIRNQTIINELKKKRLDK